MHAGLKWTGLAFVTVAFGVGCWFAYQRGIRNQRATTAEEQAHRVLLSLNSCIAKHSAGGALPATSRAFPEKLSQVFSRKLRPNKAELTEAFPECELQFASALNPQLIQFRWVQMGTRSGRVFAQADPDEAGTPSMFWEVPVVCAKSTCITPSVVFTVDEEGVRHPPTLLAATGKEHPYQGPPPSIDGSFDFEESVPVVGAEPEVGDEEEPGLPAGSDPAGLDPEKRRQRAEQAEKLLRDGKAIDYAVLQEALVAYASENMPAGALVGLDARGLRGRKVDPAHGDSVRLSFGRPDELSTVVSGTEIREFTYDSHGVSVVEKKAEGSLRVLSFPDPDCPPGKVLSSADGQATSLMWDKQTKRELWFVLGAPPAQSFFGADTCAAVRR